MLVGNHDRARAAEHGVFLSHTLGVPAHAAAHALRPAVSRLDGKLEVRFPAQTLPISLVITPMHDERRQLLELRLAAKDGSVEFFEGEVRFEGDGALTHVQLVGRFNVPPTLHQDLREDAPLRDLAEDNLVHIFEALLFELERTLQGSASGIRRTRSRRAAPRRALARRWPANPARNAGSRRDLGP